MLPVRPRPGLLAECSRGRVHDLLNAVRDLPARRTVDTVDAVLLGALWAAVLTVAWRTRDRAVPPGGDRPST